ncbi:unnamed protein product [Rhizophagus irregularis]|nr:unnamed protein product [Rhizophagus irregularis]
MKSFFSFDNITVKEIIRELKNQREVDYHDNIIRCHGITKFESIEYHVSNNYMLVMEYANNGIVHRDLHSGEEYDVGLALEILQGLGETVVPDTPENYVTIYTKCWDGEPDNRPNIYQVNAIAENLQLSGEQEVNDASSTNNSESQGDLSQLIQRN